MKILSDYLMGREFFGIVADGVSNDFGSASCTLGLGLFAIWCEFDGVKNAR